MGTPRKRRASDTYIVNLADDSRFADSLWQEVEDGAREDWNSFSYFIVTENRVTRKQSRVSCHRTGQAQKLSQKHCSKLIVARLQASPPRLFDVLRMWLTWRQKYAALQRSVAFRASTSFESRAGAVAAWLRKGRSKRGRSDANPGIRTLSLRSRECSEAHAPKEPCSVPARSCARYVQALESPSLSFVHPTAAAQVARPIFCPTRRQSCNSAFDTLPTISSGSAFSTKRAIFYCMAATASS